MGENTVAIREAITTVLKGLKDGPPKALLPRVNSEIGHEGLAPISLSDLLTFILPENVNDGTRKAFWFALIGWDSVDEASWARGFNGAELAKSAARRARTLDLLGFPAEAQDAINGQWPPNIDKDIVISDVWDPWYTEERAKEHAFYWPAYAGVLEAKGWSANAVEDLGASASEVVRRLSDPLRSEAYQSKGLVVGYVQSGKTAQFTGTVAKAIDAGYRLIIVLGGTLDMLRTQTQRRLDMELIGKENILGGMDPDDPGQRKDIDYLDDSDWDKFLSHGYAPSDAGFPDIIRLSGYEEDYKRLKKGLHALEFKSGKQDKTAPLFHRSNLFKADARVVVLKKHAGILKKLVADLKQLKINLGEIPALIIDDESDQASINTIRQGTTTVERKKRTAINAEIANLLGVLPRAQYVGYTATPFANVFVDPNDSEDIFPKDFIIALKRPVGYMGASDFHDLDKSFDGIVKNFKNSNEKAFVRDLRDSNDESPYAGLAESLDAYLLSGAIKLYRQTTGKDATFRHHTMLVHESVKQIEHRDTVGVIRDLWAGAGYSSHGQNRLEALWDADYVPVMAARVEEGVPIPPSFGELKPYIAKALDKINSNQNPVLAVNGDKDLQAHQEELSFDKNDVWRILVGGTKLSRGFTVEGLTVSYYRRKTLAADTLMQMGRWFGFRGGYKDLVRLYIGREEKTGNKHFDLYEAFESMVIDEESFRDELKQYAELDDAGLPQVRPRNVPPLVTQNLLWLAPTAANKRYNAVLTERGDGGKLKDLNALPKHSNKVNEANFQALQALFDSASKEGDFLSDSGKYLARYGVVSSATFLEALAATKFHQNADVAPQLKFLEKSTTSGKIKDWVVILPLLAEGKECEIEGAGVVRVMKRKRREDRDGAFSGSSRRQRVAVEAIAGNTQISVSDPLVDELREETRGAILLTISHDPASGESDPASLGSRILPREVAVMISYAAPYAAAPKGKIGFTVRSKSKAESAILSRGDEGFDVTDAEARKDEN